MTMLSLLEQDCGVVVDLDLDIVPDEASIDLAAALLAEAGRVDSALRPAVHEGLLQASRFTADELDQHRPGLAPSLITISQSTRLRREWYA